jgi:hypothetical protein
MTLCRCLMLTLLLLSAAGCGRPGPARYKVAGTVQWKGEPVEKGDIIFEPLEAETHPAAAKIVGGKYELRLGAGKMKVQIFASRELPGKINKDMNAPVLEHYIPPQFNRQTTLEAEVMPNDDNKLSFDLKPQI